LIDIWKELYVPFFELVFLKLKQGAYVIADNRFFPPVHQKEVEEYREVLNQKNALNLYCYLSEVELKCPI